MTLRKLVTAPLLGASWVLGIPGVALLFVAGWAQDVCIKAGWRP